MASNSRGVRQIISADGWFAWLRYPGNGELYSLPVVCFALLEAEDREADPPPPLQSRVSAMVADGSDGIVECVLISEFIGLTRSHEPSAEILDATRADGPD